MATYRLEPEIYYYTYATHEPALRVQSGDRVIAIGKTMANAELPPKPGSAPRKIPKAMPMVAHSRVSKLKDVRISNMARPNRYKSTKNILPKTTYNAAVNSPDVMADMTGFIPK